MPVRERVMWYTRYSSSLRTRCAGEYSCSVFNVSTSARGGFAHKQRAHNGSVSCLQQQSMHERVKPRYKTRNKQKIKSHEHNIYYLLYATLESRLPVANIIVGIKYRHTCDNHRILDIAFNCTSWFSCERHVTLVSKTPPSQDATLVPT